jgi:hypothetical protein
MSWRLPLVPSMMVTVRPGGVLGGAASPGGGLSGRLERSSAWPAGRALADSDFPPGLTAAMSVRTTATGSPPNGSSTMTAHPSRTTTNRLSSPTIAWGTAIGKARRRFGFLSCPRGALRSSATAAKTLANHVG